jgi:hypothetical protein
LSFGTPLYDWEPLHDIVRVVPLDTAKVEVGGVEFATD